MDTLVSILQSTSYLTLLGLGIALRLIIGMRQFNRRGLGGLQHFHNYFIGLFTLFVEGVLKWVALAMMLRGLWGWIF